MKSLMHSLCGGKLLIACENSQNNSQNGLKKVVDRIKETENQVRKFDSTMQALEEGMINTGEWVKEFSGDSLTKESFDSYTK